MPMASFGPLWTPSFNVGGKDKAGIAYFVVSPRVGAQGGLGGDIVEAGLRRCSRQ